MTARAGVLALAVLALAACTGTDTDAPAAEPEPTGEVRDTGQSLGNDTDVDDALTAPDPAAGEDVATVVDARLVDALRAWSNPAFAAAAFPGTPANEGMDLLALTGGDELEATRTADRLCTFLRNDTTAPGSVTEAEAFEQIADVIGGGASQLEAKAYTFASLRTRCEDLLPAAPPS